MSLVEGRRTFRKRTMTDIFENCTKTWIQGGCFPSELSLPIGSWWQGGSSSFLNGWLSRVSGDMEGSTEGLSSTPRTRIKCDNWLDACLSFTHSYSRVPQTHLWRYKFQSLMYIRDWFSRAPAGRLSVVLEWKLKHHVSHGFRLHDRVSTEIAMGPYT